MMPDAGTLERRILERWEASTPEEREAGRAWYPEAFRRCRAIAGETVTPYRAAAIVAALSPRCQWQTNLAWSAAIVNAKRSGRHGPPDVSTRTFRDQAWRIACGASIDRTLTGYKRRAFFAAMAGNTDAVCIDVWVRRIVGVPTLGWEPITQAFRNVAARVGVTPRDLQATVWIVERGGGD